MVDTSPVDEIVAGILSTLFRPEAAVTSDAELLTTIAIELSKELCWILYPVIESSMGFACGDRTVENLARHVAEGSLAFPPGNWEHNRRWVRRGRRWRWPRVGLRAAWAKVRASGARPELVCSRNPLMVHRGIEEGAVDLLPTPYCWGVSDARGAAPEVQQVEAYLKEEFRAALQQVAEIASPGRMFLAGYFDRVFELYARRTAPILRDRTLRRLVSRSRRVLLGTGSSITTRILAALARQLDVPVRRFDHGGDRQLFDDPLFPETDLADVDEYVTFGTKGADKYRADLSKPFLGRLEGTRVIAAGDGSLFTGPTQADAGPSKTSEEGSTLLYVSNSFGGEQRQFPYFRPNDAVYGRWQRQLVCAVTGEFSVSYKPHPKGVSLGIGLADACGVPVERARLSECIGRYKVFLVDVITTAFFELLCAGCTMVYVAAPWRSLRLLDQQAIEKAAYVVRPTKSDSAWQIDQAALHAAVRDALRFGPKGPESFIRDYVDGRDWGTPHG